VEPATVPAPWSEVSGVAFGGGLDAGEEDLVLLDAELPGDGDGVG
jgi:hypothetical protein